MSNFDRLQRIVNSWTGKLKRERYYEQHDIFMILTDLGMQMQPETLAFIINSNELMEEMAHELYSAEDQLGFPLVLENSIIDPKFKPTVIEENKKLGISITHKGKEYLIVEIEMPSI